MRRRVHDLCLARACGPRPSLAPLEVAEIPELGVGQKGAEVLEGDFELHVASELSLRLRSSEAPSSAPSTKAFAGCSQGYSWRIMIHDVT